MSVHPQEGSRDTGISSIPGYSAPHRVQVTSILNLRANVEWNTTLRYVSRLTTPNIASYVGTDTTLRWRPRDDLEMSVSGQNLFGPRRVESEYLAKVLLPSQVKRSAFVKLAWHF